MIQPVGQSLALYNGGSNWRAYMQNAFRAQILRIRPTYVKFHAGPRGLLGTDPDEPDTHDPTELHASLVAALPELKYQIAIGLDGWTEKIAANLLPLQPNDIPRATPAVEQEIATLFKNIAAMAISFGVTDIQGDSEDAAIRNPSAGKVMARLFIETFSTAAPGIRLSLTGYDDPVPVETAPGSGHTWGGVSYHFPYSAWCKDSRIAYFSGQNYVDPEKGGPNRIAYPGVLAWRTRMSARSIGAAIEKGWIDPALVQQHYVQGHHTDWRDLVSVGAERTYNEFWGAGTPNASGFSDTFDVNGADSIAMLGKLAAHGYAGPGAVHRFLVDTHTADSPTDLRFGPKARAALDALP